MLLPGCGVALLAPVLLLILMKAIIGLARRALMSFGSDSDCQFSYVKPVVGPGVFAAVGLGVKVAVSVGINVGEGVSVGVSVGGIGLAVGVFEAVGVIVGVSVGAGVDVGGGAFKALQAALKSSNKRKIRRIPSF